MLVLGLVMPLVMPLALMLVPLAVLLMAALRMMLPLLCVGRVGYRRAQFEVRALRRKREA